MPVIRASLLAVFALISCTLAIDLARAQDPTTGTTLHPGLNLIGWTAEPTPTSQLFDKIPQLEAVWAWDAELDDWIVAARGAPEWLGGLGRLTPGMGLRMQLGGNEPFSWQRSTEPTRGLVKLHTGWNLVAWSGADQTPIDDALKGIGWSLRAVHRWNSTTQQWTTWTSPERTAQLIAADNTDQETNDDSEPPAIRRGEALWINVARAVNWLQPTDILPRLVFPGGASTALQARVRQDLEATLAFFRTQYGIQANPDFTVYAAKDVDALIQAWKNDGEDVDDTRAASARARWNRVAGWAGGDIVVKQTSWPDDLSTDDVAWARYTITHEYFHILQAQLSDGWASQWLVEGTADWVEGEHEVFDGERTLDNLRDGLLSAITNDTPTLRSTESENAQWEYTLGWLATDRLIADGEPDSAIEFWRRLAPTEVGPHGRWTSTPDWQTALQRVSGQPISEFYAGFDVWQREQVATNLATTGSYDGNWIRGKVTDENGAPVAGLFVNAIRVEGETSVDWNQRAETDADGRFDVQAPQAGDYRLSVDINDDCARHYGDGQLINDENQRDDWREARPIKVGQSDVSGIDIRLPPNVCIWQVRGRIVGPNAEPLTGIRVSACSTSGGRRCYSGASTTDGSFAVTVGESGEYRIHADLGDGCLVYLRSGAPATNSSSASLITVATAHVGDVLLQVPEDLCRLRVSGTLIGADSQPLADTYVWICLGEDDNCSGGGNSMVAVDDTEADDVITGGAQTNEDGEFAITVPVEGRYIVSFNLEDCTVYFRSGGLTATFSESDTVRVEGRDARLNPRQIPADVCGGGHQITGTLFGADSEPLADTYVSICPEEDGYCNLIAGGNTDGDGAFTITVPIEGSYRVSFDLEGCTIYLRRGGLTTNYFESDTVRVEGRDVHLNPRQIPAGMCAHRISGRLVDSTGAPLSEKWIGIWWGGGSRGVWTDLDGRFGVRVPSDGAYTFGIRLRQQPSCWYHLADRALGSRNNPVRVSGADVTDITLRLPGTIEELCE